jgi:uncharacterized OB-fold protein
MEEYKAILHAPHEDSAPFWQGCNEEQFLLRVCRACGCRFYYPRLGCVKCGSQDLEWAPTSGRGAVYSFTHVHVGFYGDNWTSELPYTTALIDLDEGPRLVTRLIGDDREGVAVGDPVELAWVRAKGTSQLIPFFRRA